MENASKALIMAGGVLIALLILTLVVYLATSTSRIANSYDQKEQTEQTIAFNKEYEAYDKTKMYGVDVITVVNKAIDYNKRLDVEEEEYKINIILNLNQDFDRTKQVVTQYGDGRIEEGNLEPLLEETLKKGTYQLFERDDSEEMDDRIIEFFNQKSNNKITKTYGTTVVTIFEYSAITNFKTAIFKCENVGYSNITGRVNSMTFTQI